MKTVINIAIMVLGLSSCTSEDNYAYSPASASYLGDDVRLSIEDKNGEEYDYKEILSKKEISVYGHERRKDLSLRFSDYNGRSSLDFAADLPNISSMQYNSDRSEGYGHSDATITFKDKKTKVRFYFRYSCPPEYQHYLGMSSICIDSVGCKNKKIKPKEERDTYSFTLKEDTNGELILK